MVAFFQVLNGYPLLWTNGNGVFAAWLWQGVAGTTLCKSRRRILQIPAFQLLGLQKSQKQVVHKNPGNSSISSQAVCQNPCIFSQVASQTLEIPAFSLVVHKKQPWKFQHLRPGGSQSPATSSISLITETLNFIWWFTKFKILGNLSIFKIHFLLLPPATSCEPSLVR